MKWHYTTGQCFRSILNDRKIKPATAFLPQSEKPIVWFSTAPEWEPTANKAWQNPDGSIIRLSREKTAKLGGGLYRLGVAPETAPYDWRNLRELSGMSGRMAQSLYATAIGCGARPGNWWGTFDPVPHSKWVAIQTWKADGWVDVFAKAEVQK